MNRIQMNELKKKISSETYDSLLKANIQSLPEIISCSKEQLMQLTHLNINSIEGLLKETAHIILKGKTYTVKQIPKWHRLSTGCDSLNAVLRGGIPVNGITEIMGYSGVGKTQLCLQLSLMTQLPNYLGGLGKGVVYICTEDVFPVKRLKQMSGAFADKYPNLKINFEDDIFVEHVADVAHLKRCLFEFLPSLQSAKPIGLLVIDSIAGVFRSDNLDVNYVNRSRDFVSLATAMNELSRKHGIAVVCVNQVTDDIRRGKTEPCLGLAWGNNVTCRFNVSRLLEQMRKFEVIFAPDLPNQTCKFAIVKEGLISVE